MTYTSGSWVAKSCFSTLWFGHYMVAAAGSRSTLDLRLNIDFIPLKGIGCRDGKYMKVQESCGNGAFVNLLRSRAFTYIWYFVTFRLCTLIDYRNIWFTRPFSHFGHINLIRNFDVWPMFTWINCPLKQLNLCEQT
jgi:hypothetical protein